MSFPLLRIPSSFSLVSSRINGIRMPQTRLSSKTQIPPPKNMIPGKKLKTNSENRWLSFLFLWCDFAFSRKSAIKVMIFVFFSFSFFVHFPGNENAASNAGTDAGLKVFVRKKRVKKTTLEIAAKEVSDEDDEQPKVKVTESFFPFFLCCLYSNLLLFLNCLHTEFWGFHKFRAIIVKNVCHLFGVKEIQ